MGYSKHAEMAEDTVLFVLLIYDHQLSCFIYLFNCLINKLIN